MGAGLAYRARRAWQGRWSAPQPSIAGHTIPGCHLCPGTKRPNGEQTLDYSGTFVFDNDFAALYTGAPDIEVDIGELRRARSESVVARVVYFSPRHDLSLPNLEPAALRGVVDV